MGNNLGIGRKWKYCLLPICRIFKVLMRMWRILCMKFVGGMMRLLRGLERRGGIGLGIIKDRRNGRARRGC